VGWFQGTIRLWDLRTGQESAVLQAPCGAHCLSFSADGTLLAAGLSDSTAIVWDLNALRSSAVQTNLPDRHEDCEKRWAELADEDAAKAYAVLLCLGERTGPSGCPLKESSPGGRLWRHRSAVSPRRSRSGRRNFCK